MEAERNIYRVIYEVDEGRQAVWVLHIRHGARRKFKASDLA
jgi:mRNA-degrading endonuclease RelE of RelBE toxin-antitoxin system